MTRLTLLPLAMGLLSACGAPAHKNDGAKPAPRPELYGLDARNLAANDAMKAALWTVVAKVGGAEKARVAGGSLADVTAALKAVGVKSGDDVVLSITIKDATGKVLATNAEADAAAADAGAQAIWVKACKGKVTDAFSLRDGLNAKFDDASATVSVTLALCDFDGLLLQGAVTLEPAQEALKKHEIVFACDASENPAWAVGRTGNPASYPVFYDLKDNTCRAGYRKAAGGDAPLLEAPAGEALAAFKANDWDTVRLYLDEHDRPKLENVDELSDLAALPAFVRDTGNCNTVEFVRHFLPDGAPTAATVETRVFLDRKSAGGAMAWSLRDAGNLPFKRNVTDPFGNGAKISFYLHCTWLSEPNADVAPIALER